MDIYEVLSKVHGWSALLLFALALISVSISVMTAVRPAADRANSTLVKKANFVSIAESSVAGTLTLTGLAVAIMGPWKLSELWLWMSLLVMVFYSVALVRITKRARLEVAKGGSEIKAGMQVIFRIGHVLLLMVAYLIMLLKPV
ncbi:MAG TPA: hypothetical protein VMV80_04205 [Anaerolineales bacterium]|nr:hypothetical protein [Anaerolineales bacterium]